MNPQKVIVALSQPIVKVVARVALFVALIVCSTASIVALSSCGGGGGGEQNNRTFQISWPARSRGPLSTALSSALSVRVIFKAAAVTGADIFVNQNRDTTKTDAYTGTYDVGQEVKSTPFQVEATFFSGVAQSGDVVGTASGTATPSTESVDLASLTVQGKVSSVTITSPSTLTAGEGQTQLEYSAKNVAGAIVAISPGSAIWTINQGTGLMTLTKDGQATPSVPGTATVMVTVDGVASSLATISIVSYSETFQLSSELSVGGFPNLANGGGFVLASASGATTPSGMGSIKRITGGSPITTTTTSEGRSYSLTENGSRLDMGLEGHYYAAHGSFSLKNSTLSTIASSDYSYTEVYEVNYGRSSVRMPLSTFKSLKAEYHSNPSGFLAKYGTHYVSGASYHSYVRATYYITSLNTRTASSSEISIDAGGSWGFGSVSGNANTDAFMSKLAGSTQVNVFIETNIPNANLSKTIANPGDVAAVRQEIANLTNLVGSADPVPYGFYITPWTDVLSQQSGGPNTTEGYFNQITQDYSDALVLKNALNSILGNSVKYAFLGTEVTAYYQSRLGVVEAEVTRLENLLKQLDATPSLGQNYRKTDLRTQFVLPPTVRINEFSSLAGNSMYLDVFSYGATNYSTIRLMSPGGTPIGPRYSAGPAVSHKSGPLPADNFTRIFFDYRGTTNPFWNGTRSDTSGWRIEFLDSVGNVVVSRPMPS